MTFEGLSRAETVVVIVISVSCYLLQRDFIAVVVVVVYEIAANLLGPTVVGKRKRAESGAYQSFDNINWIRLPLFRYPSSHLTRFTL